jgi:hypothetical protein
MVNKFSDLEITNSPAGKSSPAQTSIERAIGDLRRGALVILRDAPNQTGSSSAGGRDDHFNGT